MPKIRIKQLNERVATAGLHMGEAEGEAFRRKLEPGEVVDVPEDIEIVSNRWDDPICLFDMLYDTGLVDVLPDKVPVTRPLDYLNYREGMLCSPTFSSLSPSDAAEREQAMQRVEQRLAKEAAEKHPVDPDEEEPEEAPPPKAARSSRRRGRRTAGHGEAHTT